MIQQHTSKIYSLLKTYRKEILASWLEEQYNGLTARKDLISDKELAQQSEKLLTLFQEAVQTSNLKDINTPEWDTVKRFLEEISRQRSQQGFSPSETATFIFSLKQPLFSFLSESAEKNKNSGEDLWLVSNLLDKLGIFTIETYQKSREELIKRHQEEMLELSTPVVKLWDGVLALPMIGTLDSNRTQIVMENLLQKIVETGCDVAIIDITGVPNVDTLVAQHLLKTVTAAKLMGAECIISGIRPQIAQTIVHLGVDLAGVSTKASLADAFKLALRITGRSIALTETQKKPVHTALSY